LLSEAAAQRQARQFGANCDAVAYFPASGNRSDRGTLCVNNEYVVPELMFSGRRRMDAETAEELQLWNQQHPHAVALMKAAHGVSIIEVSRTRGAWRLQVGAPQTRRITAESGCEITAARGRRCCVQELTLMASGCVEPWQLRRWQDTLGTYLTAEEKHRRLFRLRPASGRYTDDTSTRGSASRFELRDRSPTRGDHVDARLMCAMSRTKHFASAGSSRSIREIHRPHHASAPLWGGSRTRAQTRNSPVTGAWPYIWATTRCSSMSTSS
jgi:secreted PhoX family phosphatase